MKRRAVPIGSVFCDKPRYLASRLLHPLTSPRAPWLLSVTESVALPPQPDEGGQMSDTHKFDLREWLVPPVLLPIFFALLIAAAVIISVVIRPG